MSGYGYGPPPPPPATSGYSRPAGSYSHQGQGRGGGGSHGSRGRGGQYPRSRGDYHAPPPQPHYDYAGQPYPQHHQAAYGASPPAGSYPPHTQQWRPDHGPAPHVAHPHAPVPLSASNYHPNYVPQPYAPSQHAQQPPYGPAQPYAGQPYQGHAAATPTHWSPQPPHYSGGRGRGGYGGDRGGSRGAHMSGPARHGYEHEPVPPVGGAYGQPYAQDPRAPHYPPAHFPYQGPPPPPSGHHDGQYGQYPRRGRGGGGHRDGGLRGRGGHHHGGQKGRHNKKDHHEKKTKPEPPPIVGKKKKRKVNTLGLTPGNESETEDDEGEEKALTDLIGAETLQISDVAAFLAERRKNFPTKARVEARKAAEVAQKGEDKTAELEKQADKLRRQLRKVESSIKRKREQGDEGDEMRDPSDHSSDDEKPEVMSSRKQAGSSAPPPPPAKKADVSRHCKYYSTGGTCGKKGKCRFVHDPEVREAAIKEREANNGRLTIQQRLILNDKEQEDLTVLQSIQYLRQKGIMDDSANGDANDDAEVKAEQKAEQEAEQVEDSDSKSAPPVHAPTSSLLPAAPSSLPAPPIKKEASLPSRNPQPSSTTNADSTSEENAKHYEGWLLQPYGSSNDDTYKTDDLP